MTRVYRILRKRYARTPFDGEGAFRFGGRWSSPGNRLVYTSERLSLAMIEYYIHIDSDDSPPELVVATADVPKTSPARRSLLAGSARIDERVPPHPTWLPNQSPTRGLSPPSG
ncbi:MAG: RES domain-containing protein [Bryobacteraceae bacterium]